MTDHISSLPAELATIIGETLPVADLHALRRTCKQLDRIYSPIVFRQVTITLRRGGQQLFRMLEQKERGQLIRRLVVIKRKLPSHILFEEDIDDDTLLTEARERRDDRAMTCNAVMRFLETMETPQEVFWMTDEAIPEALCNIFKAASQCRVHILMTGLEQTVGKEWASSIFPYIHTVTISRALSGAQRLLTGECLGSVKRLYWNHPGGPLAATMEELPAGWSPLQLEKLVLTMTRKAAVVQLAQMDGMLHIPALTVLHLTDGVIIDDGWLLARIDNFRSLQELRLPTWDTMSSTDDLESWLTLLPSLSTVALPGIDAETLRHVLGTNNNITLQWRQLDCSDTVLDPELLDALTQRCASLEGLALRMHRKEGSDYDHYQRLGLFPRLRHLHLQLWSHRHCEYVTDDRYLSQSTKPVRQRLQLEEVDYYFMLRDIAMDHAVVKSIFEAIKGAQGLSSPLESLVIESTFKFTPLDPDWVRAAHSEALMDGIAQCWEYDKYDNATNRSEADTEEDMKKLETWAGMGFLPRQLRRVATLLWPNMHPSCHDISTSWHGFPVGKPIEIDE